MLVGNLASVDGGGSEAVPGDGRRTQATHHPSLSVPPVVGVEHPPLAIGLAFEALQSVYGDRCKCRFGCAMASACHPLPDRLTAVFRPIQRHVLLSWAREKRRPIREGPT